MAFLGDTLGMSGLNQGSGTAKKEKYLSILLAVGVALAIVAYGVWSTGQGSEITVTTSSGVHVFVNGELEGQTGTFKRSVSVKKAAGDYSIIAAKDDHWPWMKNISLGLNEKATLRPFLFPRDVKRTEIPAVIPRGNGTAPNPQYEEAIAIFNQAAIRSEVSEILPTLNIESIKYADFYPGRNDLLIIAAKNQIFVIETGAGTPRNFQPLMSGADPSFVRDGNMLYVKDGDTLFFLDLASIS